ncbi:MAG: serine/threonine-protein kinase, partial [Nannocystaceae bacterium]
MSTIEHMPTQAQAASQMTPQRVAQSPESVTSPDPVLRSIRYSSAAPIHIGRYSVLQMLGQGGMGAVYACYDERLDRKVAVKVLRVGAASDRAVASARLVREGQALARLSHPNVVTVHEVGSTGEEVYVAMEFVKGMSLDVWATHKHSWQETLDVLIQAGRGLAAAHKAGIIHRDFKPQNVIVSEDGHVKVLDFGLARASGERVRKEWLGSGMSDSQVDLRGDFMRPLTVTGSLVGTPAYMSPEQYCGDPVTAASDQFSFCASLYQCLFGELPFTTSSYEGLRNDIMAGRVAPLPLRSPVPSWVYRSLCRGMQAFPEQRFASMNELLTTLDRRRGSRRALLAAALALATFTGATGFYAAQSTDPMIEVCPDASAELEGIWDSMRIQEVRTALAATGSPQATAIQASVLPQLDAYAEAWTQMRNEACRTHAEGRQADALFDRRMACLDQRRAGLATLGELLVHPEVDKLPNLAEAAFSLPPLDRCADA